MPTYEYACPSGHEFELFQKMSDKPRAKCPACGKLAVRKISGGAGLHFKGSGFYITDYGKDGKGPRNDKARESSETPTKVADAGKAAAPESTAKPAAAEKPAPKAEKAPAKKAKASE
jgi:putative FmdB family regulatory protein